MKRVPLLLLVLSGAKLFAQYNSTKIPQIAVAGDSFSLNQNYPNPAIHSTQVSFKLEREAMVILKLFDPLGNQLMVLVNGKMKAGEYNIPIDASSLNPGIYFYRLVVDGRSETKKLTIRK